MKGFLAEPNFRCCSSHPKKGAIMKIKMKIYTDIKLVDQLRAYPELTIDVDISQEELGILKTRKYLDYGILDAIARVINFGVQHMQ